MNGQMSIFDFLPAPAGLDDIPEEDMVHMVSDATGLDFKYRDESWGWEAKKGKYIARIQYQNYDLKDNQSRFIGCDWASIHEGSSSPCDSVDEAINFFKKRMSKAEETKR